jgi:phosphoglycerate dehydrogenase-like enzyme
VPIAQYVLGMMLRIVKRMDEWSEAQREARWENIESGELTGRTVGIVGAGHIGGEVARLSKALGMRVVASRRSPRRPRHVDDLLPLDYLLPQSDFVVLAVPLTTSTERLIGERELKAMKGDAWLINIARGRVIDEPALIQALKRRTIGGAVLDVFEQEPLQPESELWSLPNVIVTPHNSGRSTLNLHRQTELFIENLQRFVDRRPLRNLVRLKDL